MTSRRNTGRKTPLRKQPRREWSTNWNRYASNETRISRYNRHHQDRAGDRRPQIAAKERKIIMKIRLSHVAFAIGLAMLAAISAQAADKKPNILVIWGDDIGWNNPSIYHRGDMGYW